LTTSQVRILIVEDNALNLELATDLLTVAGYSIRQARTGEEGLRLARLEPPALILPDLRMPGLDGYTTLRALREDPRTAAIRTVALTAQAMTGDKQAALAAGFDDYIAKPIDTKTFSHTVARVLGSAA
jgi:CheY-like chemotaxis protein